MSARQVAALMAEVEALRLHTRRQAARRRVRQERARAWQATRPSAHLQWVEVGREEAMREIIETANETALMQYKLTGKVEPGGYGPEVATALVELAAGVIELRRPQELWLSEGDIL